MIDFIFLRSKITVDCDCSHEIKSCLLLGRTSIVAQMVKNLPAVQETWVRSPGQEEHLEKEMTTHSSIFAEELGGSQSMGYQRVGHD